jgi:hypothetical protein
MQLQSVIDGSAMRHSQRNTHAVLHVDGGVASALGNCTVPQEFVLVNN